MEPVKVERATNASRIFAVVAALALAALVALPWWGDAGTVRLVGEMAYYLALAQLWNLLAGYAGLVSVGQQAYVGLGGYFFFYTTGSHEHERVPGAAARRAVCRTGVDPCVACGVPAARSLFRHRQLGGVGGVRAIGESDRGAGRRLGTIADAGDRASDIAGPCRP